MIGAKTFMKLIKNQLQSELKTTVNKFAILHNPQVKSLKFIVNGKEYPFNSSNLMGLIEGKVKEQFRGIKGVTIDRILIDYDDEKPVSVITFFTDELGNKSKKEKTI